MDVHDTWNFVKFAYTKRLENCGYHVLTYTIMTSTQVAKSLQSSPGAVRDYTTCHSATLDAGLDS